MGFYIRKSVRVGPFRFNLSKSGIGASAGIKGLRLGTGPHGNYIHMGRGGLYYRKTLSYGKNRPHPLHPSQNLEEPPSQNIPVGTHEPLRDIESGEIDQLVDSSSKALVEELNAKRKRLQFWPYAAVATVIVSIGAALQGFPAWTSYAALGIGALLTAVAFYKDILRKTTVLLYDIESDLAEAVEELHFAFEKMKSCRSIWHLEAEGRVSDQKYHAGASHLVRRHEISLTTAHPPFVKTNVATPGIPVGKQTLYFFPDKVLVFEPNGVGAVSYDDLDIEISHTRFIEEQRVPKDAEIIDKTWEYVNKRGGPDKRFKDNRQLPVVLYEEVHFSSNTGLNERIQLSCSGRAATLAKAINKVAIQKLQSE